MLSEFSNSSPRHILLRARCSVSTSHRLLPARVEARGSGPLQLHGSRPGAGVRLHRSSGGGSSSAPPSLPGPGEMPAQPSRSPWRRMVRAGCGCSCRGSLRADGNGESFISPRCRGKGAGRGRPRKFSFCHHRTKNRMSTTSKMTKRTTIAHHCRRSGKKRKHQSSCFSGEDKLEEHFSLCTARNQIQA